MIKQIVLFIALMSSLYSNEININDLFIENNKLSIELKKNPEANLDELISSQSKYNTNIISLLKNSDTKLLFITDFDIAKYNNKIAINESRNNTLAVYRDLLAVNSYRIKDNLYKLLNELNSLFKSETLANQLDIESIKTIISDNQDKMNFLNNKIDFETIDVLYIDLIKKENPTSIESDFIMNYDEFKLNNNSYFNFTTEIKNQIKKSERHSYLESLKEYIDEINNYKYISSVNYYLSVVDIDSGKLLLATLTFLIIFMLRRYVFKLINFILLKFKKETNNFSYMIFNLVKIKIEYLVIAFGFHQFINILYYGNNTDTFGQLMFSIYAIILGIGFYQVVDLFAYEKIEIISNKFSSMRNEMINLMLKIVKGLIIIIFTLLILYLNGINITGIIASLGIGGIAIALASKDTLTNFFGSVAILADNSFQQGDWISVNGLDGTVIEIKLRTTTIRTFDNAMITVPNSTLANSSITNWNRRKLGRRIKMHLSVTYESDIDDVIKAKNEIKEMLEEHPGIASSKKNDNMSLERENRLISIADAKGFKKTLLVFLDEYSDSDRKILIYCFSRTTQWEEWLEVKEDVLVKIDKILKNNNVGMAYPTVTNIIRQEA